MYKSKPIQKLQLFAIPLIVFVGILCALVARYFFHIPLIAQIILMCVIFVGSLELIQDTLQSLLKRKFALDYIALLAISVGVLTQQYVVAAVIVLMLSGGNTLEKYGMDQAKASLTALTDRIPNNVTLWENNQIGTQTTIESININQEIAIRKGEIIPLDGVLISDTALLDESSLTGEPYMSEKIKHDYIRSGTINVGNLIVLRVTKTDKDSTYRKIINIVLRAQKEKAPLIRLADQYSTIFTCVTLALATLAYIVSRDFSHVLAVLVIATPCPLILATPIALMGGMNAAAKQRIIMKKLSSIEVLSRVDAIIFDKTGTITVGKPSIRDVIILDKTYSQEQVGAIASAIERNSLHPLAKAIVLQAKANNFPILQAVNTEETIGRGISGLVNGTQYHLTKVKDHVGMAIELTTNDERIALFEFEDKMKEESARIIQELQKLGLLIYLFTGDKKEAADRVAKQLGSFVVVKAECSPEDKKNGIEQLKKEGKVTAMIGDGINDAPALALADVGMVFSNEEHTASTEAADIVFLGGDFSSVIYTIAIAKRTIRIAKESIFIGIGLSILGMIFAAFGLLPAIAGAFAQEAIDVAVIINALRSSEFHKKT